MYDCEALPLRPTIHVVSSKQIKRQSTSGNMQTRSHNYSHTPMTTKPQREQFTNEAETEGGMCDPDHTYDEISTFFLPNFAV